MTDLDAIEADTNREDGIYCFVCKEKIIEFYEDGQVDSDSYTPCVHLSYLYIGNGGGFETVSEEMQKFLDEQDDEFSAFDFISKPNQYANIVTEHTESGVCCSPFQITAYYGWKTA